MGATQTKESRYVDFSVRFQKALKEAIGQPLKYRETPLFDEEYRRDGYLTGSNRPQITGIKGREFFANVTMKDGKIDKVE